MPDDVGGAVLEGALSVKGTPIALLTTGPDRALSAISQLQHRVVDEGGLRHFGQHFQEQVPMSTLASTGHTLAICTMLPL